MKKAIIIIALALAQGCASLDKMPDSQMKYNYMENRWEMTPASSTLRWNYYENCWQWSN